MADLCTPWCLHAVATLRIADRIAAGIADGEELARAAGCDAGVLQAVLRHLIAKGVFEETEPGRFALNDAARGLFDPALLLGLDLNGIGGRMAYAWSTLPDYVHTGVPGYRKVFGLPFWEDLDAHPDIAASFDALIGPMGHGAFDPHFPLTGGWDAVRWVVDVGGGAGAMLAEILRAHATIRGTLVELPRTVARALETFRSAGVGERATGVGQSFFDPLPAGADVYLLRGVVNNWPDREAGALLTRCAEAARPSGRVVILKSIDPDAAPGALGVDMLLTGGKRRTVSEFRELARRSGLEIVAAGREGSTYFTVECRPV